MLACLVVWSCMCVFTLSIVHCVRPGLVALIGRVGNPRDPRHVENSRALRLLLLAEVGQGACACCRASAARLSCMYVSVCLCVPDGEPHGQAAAAPAAQGLQPPQPAERRPNLVRAPRMRYGPPAHFTHPPSSSSSCTASLYVCVCSLPVPAAVLSPLYLSSPVLS